MESRRKFGQHKERVNNRGLKSTPQENIEDVHNTSSLGLGSFICFMYIYLYLINHLCIHVFTQYSIHYGTFSDALYKMLISLTEDKSRGSL